MLTIKVHTGCEDLELPILTLMLVGIIATQKGMSES